MSISVHTPHEVVRTQHTDSLPPQTDDLLLLQLVDADVPDGVDHLEPHLVDDAAGLVLVACAVIEGTEEVQGEVRVPRVRLVVRSV